MVNLLIFFILLILVFFLSNHKRYITHYDINYIKYTILIIVIIIWYVIEKYLLLKSNEYNSVELLRGFLSLINLMNVIAFLIVDFIWYVIVNKIF